LHKKNIKKWHSIPINIVRITSHKINNANKNTHTQEEAKQ